MVASENPLRPSARSLAARAGCVYMPRHAAPSRDARYVLCSIRVPALHSSSFAYIYLSPFEDRPQRSIGPTLGELRDSLSPSSPSSTIFFCSSLSQFRSVSLGLPSFSPFLSRSLSLFLSLFSSSNFSFSLSRRNSRFPALSKINTSQRGLKTCVNMVLHCLYVHITLSAPGYYHHTEPRRPLRRPSRLFIAVIQVRGGREEGERGQTIFDKATYILTAQNVDINYNYATWYFASPL